MPILISSNPAELYRVCEAILALSWGGMEKLARFFEGERTAHKLSLEDFILEKNTPVFFRKKLTSDMVCKACHAIIERHNRGVV